MEVKEHKENNMSTNAYRIRKNIHLWLIFYNSRQVRAPVTQVKQYVCVSGGGANSIMSWLDFFK